MLKNVILRMVVSGNMDKTIRRITDRRQQQIETYRYWQSLPPGELAFNEQGVEYLAVGGYAVGVHLEPRASKALDIFIRADVRNSEAVFHALGAYDAPLEGLTAENFQRRARFNFSDSKFHLSASTFLQSIDGVAFDDAWNDRIEGLVDGESTAHIISKEHLI